jgi:two-component system OmpR family response regulator
METMVDRDIRPNELSWPKASNEGTHELRPDTTSLLDLRVLVIEDDVEIAVTIQRALQKSGMRAAVAHTGADAVALKPTFEPQVVLVDLDLPDVDGDTLIRWLLEQRDCGIIVVSGHGDEAHRVLSLELGADDYVTKPPNLRELVARIRSVHRRSIWAAYRSSLEQSSAPKSGVDRQLVTVGSFVFDRQLRQIRDRTGNRVDVTAAEFAVMSALIDAKGLPVAREQLSEIALRRPWRPEDRGVDQLIFGLRRKLPASADGHGLIQSIRNAGYALVLASAAADPPALPELLTAVENDLLD